MRSCSILICMVFLSFFFITDVAFSTQSAAKVVKNPKNDMVFHPTLKVWIPGNLDEMPPALKSKKTKTVCSASSSRAMTIIKSFGFPSSWAYARDIAWDGKTLWMGENLNSSIYQIDPANGIVVSKFYGPSSNPWGLAWNGVNLYSGTITMYHKPPGDTLPDYVYTVTTTGSKLNQWEAPDSPDATPHGAAYDTVTGSLWLSDGYYNMIYELNPANGAVLSSFSFPGVEPHGLTWDGSYLYAIDNPTQTLYKLDTSGNTIDTVSIAALGDDPEGLTWDGQYFWITENQNDMIYQIDAGMLTLISDVAVISQSVGGIANFTLKGGPANANRNYLLLGSVSGTSPGLPLPGGYATLPLNWDAFTGIVVDYLNSALFNKFLGNLNASGNGMAAFDTQGPFSGAAGLSIYFAYACNQPWDFTSNYVTITITP